MIKKLNALKNQKGMTLVELLAVMVIIGIIAAISIPAIGTLMENTRKDAHVSNATNIAEAARLYVASTEADLQAIFAENEEAEITFTYDSGQWETTEDLPSFDGYVDNFLDPHVKTNYEEATLVITRTDNVYHYAVQLTGAKVSVGEIDAPSDPVEVSEITRKNVQDNN